MKNSKLLKLVKIVAVLFAGPLVGLSQIYSFNPLNGAASGKGTDLVGQDNWALAYSATTSPGVRNPTASFVPYGSDKYIYNSGAATWYSAGRKNDSNWSFSIAPGDTSLVFQTSMLLGQTRRAMAGIGVDVNNDGFIIASTTHRANEEVFSIGSNAANEWTIFGHGTTLLSQAGSGATAISGSTYEIWDVRLTVDLNANSNNGSGLFEVRRVNTGGALVEEPSWSIVASDVNMGFQNLGVGVVDGRLPENWNGIFAMLNINSGIMSGIEVAAIPEPASAALFIGFASLIIVRISRRKR